MAELKNFIPSDEVGFISTMVGAMSKQLHDASHDLKSPGKPMWISVYFVFVSCVFDKSNNIQCSSLCDIIALYFGVVFAFFNHDVEWKGTLCTDELYLSKGGNISYDQATQRTVGGNEFASSNKVISANLSTKLEQKINKSSGSKFRFAKPELATRYTIWYLTLQGMFTKLKLGFVYVMNFDRWRRILLCNCWKKPKKKIYISQKKNQKKTNLTYFLFMIKIRWDESFFPRGSLGNFWNGCNHPHCNVETHSPRSQCL